MRLQAYVYLGWSPILAVASDGARRVLQVVGWEGGTGTAPATGLYVGASGYVSNIADGVDIAGGAGGGGAAISGGTNSQNTGTVNFSNSNGVSFGLNTNGVMTATVATNYQSQGAYLTTAMLSNAGSNFVGLNSALTGNGVSATINSSGISLNVPAFLTTAQPVGAYLTTARASNDAIGLNSALTANGVSVTANSSGLSLNFPAFLTTAQPVGAYLTTAMLSNAATISNIKVSAGTLSALRSDLTFNNGNGVTFGLETNGVITASVAAAGGAQTGVSGISAGTTQMTSGTLSIADGGGVSFGMNGNTLTATVRTDYQSAGAYLTTAMASNRGSDFVQATAAFAGTNASGTIASNGISVSVNAGGAALKGSGTYTQNTGTIEFANSNGITFGLSNNGTMTASHNGLTTAAQSNQVVNSLNGSTGQISLNVGSSLSASTNGSSITFGLASNITTALQSAGAYLTTAAQSNQVVNSINGSTGIFSFNTGSSLSSSRNGNSITWGLASNITTALQSAGNYLTTARASNDAIGLNTAQSNVTWTVNSSGLSFDGRGYAGTGTTFNGANISGSITQNSNGVQLSLSAGAGGGVTPVASASNGSFSFTTLAFSNANNVTFGTSAGSIITASINPGVAAENNWINLLGANTAGNTTASGSTIGWSGQGVTLSGTNGSQVVISAPATSSLSGTGQVSLSVNGSTISIGVPNALTLSYFNPQDAYVQVAGQQGQASLHIQPAQFPNVQYDRIMMPIINTNATNSSGSHTLSFWMGVYTKNDSTLSLASSISGSTAVTHSGTAGSYASYSGVRLFSIGSTNTITEGQYWIGILSRTASGGANGTYSQVLASQMNSSYFGLFGAATNASQQYTRGLGVYSATTSGMPNSIAFSEIIGNSSVFLRQPIFYVVSGTV